MGFRSAVNLLNDSNNIDIGNAGVAGDAGVIRIGMVNIQTATFLAGVRGVAIAGGMPVGVSASGQLGVRSSSARFKEAIKPMDKASEAIFSLQPVTFRYKKALDPEALPQFGLVAEQVAKVDPDLVARDAAGKPYTVRYEEVNAMLLNEFLKEHRKVEEQATKGQEQDVIIAELKLTKQEQHCAAAEGNCCPHRSPQSAGSANPEGERPASDTGSCSPCGGERLMKIWIWRGRLVLGPPALFQTCQSQINH